ncbi:MAG: hypothetical protein KGZ65_00110 [Sphingomonadales bacterium]|nr:hypothetical protein [Sphingomonadaceae bacterium]MBS3929609.1 hypothetical protein [Sphingomonadales bacterium]
MKVKYEADAHHTLIVEDIKIGGGRTADVPDAVGKRLLADPEIPVSQVAEPEAKQTKPTASSAGQTKKEK